MAHQIKSVDTEDEIAEIVRMLQILREESPEYNFVEDDPKFVHRNLSYLIFTDPNFKAIIIPTVGFMLGTIGSQWYSKRVDFYESLLYVTPEKRGGMAAVRLIKAMEQKARSANCHSFYAGASTGLQENKTLELYCRLGFRKHGGGVIKEL